MCVVIYLHLFLFLQTNNSLHKLKRALPPSSSEKKWFVHLNFIMLGTISVYFVPKAVFCFILNHINSEKKEVDLMGEKPSWLL